MEKIKEWFVSLLPVIGIVLALLYVLAHKLSTGENLLSGLADLTGGKEEGWIDGVQEAVAAMKA
jgi:hypothetical protein